jgi:SOS-response transcriptional repressor LexA
MTERQLQLLQFIRNLVVHYGKGPTFKEMRKHMGVTSDQAITDVLQVLKREGFIEQEKGKFRGITVTPKGMVSLLPESPQDNKPEDLSKKAVSGYYGASTSAGFEPGVYVFSTLSPSISNLATIEEGEKSGGGT